MKKNARIRIHDEKTLVGGKDTAPVKPLLKYFLF
jgi:hypothetical protein